jgi:hypothetical protein
VAARGGGMKGREWMDDESREARQVSLCVYRRGRARRENISLSLSAASRRERAHLVVRQNRRQPQFLEVYIALNFAPFAACGRRFAP